MKIPVLWGFLFLGSSSIDLPDWRNDKQKRSVEVAQELQEVDTVPFCSENITAAFAWLGSSSRQKVGTNSCFYWHDHPFLAPYSSCVVNLQQPGCLDWRVFNPHGESHNKRHERQLFVFSLHKFEEKSARDVHVIRTWVLKKVLTTCWSGVPEGAPQTGDRTWCFLKKRHTLFMHLHAYFSWLDWQKQRFWQTKGDASLQLVVLGENDARRCKTAQSWVLFCSNLLVNSFAKNPTVGMHDKMNERKKSTRTKLLQEQLILNCSDEEQNGTLTSCALPLSFFGAAIVVEHKRG